MQINLEDLKKLRDLDWEQFEKKFKFNGMEKGILTIDQYTELLDLWQALTTGHTTPEEYFERIVKGTWLPTEGEPNKIIL